MTSQYSIIIKNMSGQTMSFYAFQKTGSLCQWRLGSRHFVQQPGLRKPGTQCQFGGTAGFQFRCANYVGAKSTATASSQVKFNASLSMVSAKTASSSAAAVQPID